MVPYQTDLTREATAEMVKGSLLGPVAAKKAGRRSNKALFPKVPVRQFVLTVPMRLRFRMASSPPLTSAILRCFIAAVTSDLRRRARRLEFSGNLKTGAMTVVQRFGSSLAFLVAPRPRGGWRLAPQAVLPKRRSPASAAQRSRHHIPTRTVRLLPVPELRPCEVSEPSRQ